MKDVTTVQLKKSTIKALKAAKEYPEQTYNSLVLRMLKIFDKMNQRNQYDEFLHKIQQQKMNTAKSLTQMPFLSYLNPTLTLI